MVIAIDGTSGSGKSAIAKALSERLKVDYLNTGLLYRMIAKECLFWSVDRMDSAKIAEIAERMDLGLEEDGLHDERISEYVPYVAMIPEVRTIVRRQQRSLAARKSIIVEGRDIGSVVFPRAELKLFVTASVDVRAARRHAQLGAGSGETLESVKANIERRDYADQHRHESPLKPCADSWVIDTSDRSIEEILSMILARLAKMGAK